MNESMTEERCAAVRAAERQFTITRVFDAPPEAVFRAWTEPERLMRWWGPEGFSTPFCTIDLRPEGIFHYCLRSPEGRDYWGKGTYREVERPRRLVYADSFSDEAGGFVPPSRYRMDPEWPDETLITVTFEDRAGKTRLTIDGGVPETLAKRQLADKGWSESLDCLAEYLAAGEK